MKKKIIDMNVDCIGHILKLLNLQDLLSVSEANVILCSVACIVISKRYFRQNLTITLEGSQFIVHSKRLFKIINNAELYALNFRAGLKLLQYFGHVCTRVRINYLELTLKQRKLIEHYLGECCNNQEPSCVIEIMVENCTKDALRWIKTPLNSVQRVVVSGQTKLNFEELNKKIPNMNYLRLTWVQIYNSKCIEKHFSALKHLEIEVHDRKHCFTEENIQNAKSLNPQINSLVVKNMKKLNI